MKIHIILYSFVCARRQVDGKVDRLADVVDRVEARRRHAHAA